MDGTQPDWFFHASFGFGHFHHLLRLQLHPREGEPFLSEVFQRGADVIDCAVDAEEAVMNLVKHLNFNWLVLRVVFGEVQFQLCGNCFGVDGCGNVLAALVQYGQHRVVHIIVEQYDAFLRGAYKVAHE